MIFFIFLINVFISKKNFTFSKSSVYECGFESFSHSKENYDLKYFLVGILFLIFDIEIIFLIPLSLNFFYLNYYGFWLMFFFLFMLTMGFIFEWKKGALNIL